MALQKKQIRLVNEYLETGSLTDAAQAVGYSHNYTGQLYGLAKDPTTPLGAYLEKRREEISHSITITRESKRNKLWQIVEQCAEKKPFAALKAIHELNLMDGHYAPQKMDVRTQETDRVVFEQHI